MSRYVESVITRETGAVSRAGFGTVLVLGTTKAAEYKEYMADEAVSGVTTDFGADSKELKLIKAIMGQNPRPAKVAVLGVLFDEASGQPTTLTAALSTLLLSKSDWYFLTCTSQKDAVITALAGWTATQDKAYFASTSNKTLGTTLNQLQTVILVHDKPETYPAEALVGAIAPLDPGTYTATFKTLSGIAAASFNTTEINQIHAANGNTYIREGGVNITSNGKTTGGEWFDIIQSQHYLNARIVENVFGLLVSVPKVPFDAGGIAMTVARVESAIKGAPDGMIARDEGGKLIYTITAPDISEISANDKANRLLPGIKWRVTLAGAIEKVEVEGVLAI